MIDIHTHILPGVDDGAEDIIDAALMAELSVESGIKTVIATPHSEDVISKFGETPYDALRVQLLKMRNHFLHKRIPLQVLSGMEIYVTENVVEMMQKGAVIPLNNSKRYLMEFGFYKRSAWIQSILEEVCQKGYQPVIAHPERYICVQRNPRIVNDWVDMGCQLQANKGSFFGRFGEDSYWTVKELMNKGMLTYVASDAHSPYQRTTYMKDIYDYLELEYSKVAANKLLKENAEKYIVWKMQ